MLKRLFDVFFAIVIIIVLGPLLLAIALWVRLDSAGPALFRQYRVGLNGKEFLIYKFRTMHKDASLRNFQITIGSDPRITRAGALLRKYKFDELPQFFNVILGDMSIVGPRPEVPHYINMYSNEVRKKVLSIRPGITDRAAIELRNEAELLSTFDDPIRAYITEFLPKKQKIYIDYVNNRSFVGDIKLIFATIWVLLKR